MSTRFPADFVLAVLLATLLCGGAVADATREPFDAKFSLSVGAFFTDHDTNIRLDTVDGPGTAVNVGWHLINVEVDLDRSVSGWLGRFDWETRGPMIYGSLLW